MKGECTATLTGEHMFTPKKIGSNWASALPGEVTLINELQCRCGAFPKSSEAVREQLAATAAERRRQRELSKSLTGRKRMDELGTPPLPGFENL